MKAQICTIYLDMHIQNNWILQLCLVLSMAVLHVDCLHPNNIFIVKPLNGENIFILFSAVVNLHILRLAVC